MRRKVSDDGLKQAITTILKYVGENPERIGLAETPDRVVRMYKEFFIGYHKRKKPKITVIPNGEDGIFYDCMLRDEGYFFSFCEHHLIPFFGTYYFGYIPDKLVLGASKIARTVDYFSGKFQIAERLVNEIVNEIEETSHPKGQILIMNARHLCKEMRGVKKVNSPYEAIAVTGYFSENRDGCKTEFLLRIGK